MTRAIRLSPWAIPVLAATALADPAPVWNRADVQTFQAALECRLPLPENTPALRLLRTTRRAPVAASAPPVSPRRQDDALWIGTAVAPGTFRVFGLPVHKVYFYRMREKEATVFVAIAAFHENVAWTQLLRAARLKMKRVMGEEAPVRKTRTGGLEAWREPPYWVELAEQAPDGAGGRLYLSCGSCGRLPCPAEDNFFTSLATKGGH
ncbi:MAG: hypothetical protein LBO79_01080 [Zoogloeaceae bacterium]|jgi:hypothetical protein|nr:hypothetical protein [Zoogloeaceae bacterium]